MHNSLSRRSFILGGITAVGAGLAGCRPPTSNSSSGDAATLRAPSGDATAPRTSSPTGLFREVAAQAGIHYVQGHGNKRPLNILETIGSGCAFLDFDNDGWLDILLIGQPSCALYRNRRDGTFEDVTAKSGLAAHGHWLGCAVGDFDNDGHPDLYISGYHCGALYRNRGNGTFEDVTTEMGIRPQGWETACGFLDADGDGKLDLYVGRYVEFGPDTPQHCPTGDVMTVCGPVYYQPEYGSLYSNRNGKYVEQPGALKGQSGKCLAVAFANFDGSGRPAIAIANDLTPGNLFKNLGDGRFQDVALAAGTAFGDNGLLQSGMGLDWADYNNDGLLDLVATNYHTEATSLYTNQGNGRFVNHSLRSGLGLHTIDYVKWGVRFFDYDNDGLLDLMFCSGHALPGLEKQDAVETYPERMLLFHNEGNEHFAEVPADRAGPAFGKTYVGRGLAVGDYDNDGRLDVLVTDAEGSVLLLHNEAPNTGHWIEIDLEGGKEPRNGEGAIIRLMAGEKKLMRNITTSGSYLSANPSRAHFGLGAADEARNVVVEWPWGAKQPIGTLKANRFYKIRQGSSPLEMKLAKVAGKP